VTEAHLPRAPAVPGSHRSSPGDHGGGLGSGRTVPGQQGARGRNPRGGKGVKGPDPTLPYLPRRRASEHRPTPSMVVPWPCAVAAAVSRYGIELTYADDDMCKHRRCPIARLCPHDHLLRHVFRRRAAACTEVGNWASSDRVGVWRAGTYQEITVCHASCIG